MIEIKFRGLNGNGWHYGAFHKVFYEDLNDYEYYIYDSFGTHRVESKTISQYTGLKTKNHCDIYNNDLVKFKYHYHEIEDIGKIVWDSYSASFRIRHTGSDFPISEDVTFLEVVDQNFDVSWGDE